MSATPGEEPTARSGEEPSEEALEDAALHDAPPEEEVPPSPS